MQTDPRPHVALPLAHDHFCRAAKRHARRTHAADFERQPELDIEPAHDFEPEPAAQPANDFRPKRFAWPKRAPAPTADGDEDELLLTQPISTPPSRRVLESAKRARAATEAAATRVMQAFYRTGGQSYRFVTKAGRWLTQSADHTSIDLDAVQEQSRYSVLANRLASLADLSESQHALVRANLPGRQIHQAGSMLVSEGEESPNPAFILSGWACRTRLHEGRLHVLRVLLPGDGIELMGQAGEVSSTAITAMTTLETVAAQPLIDIVERADGDSMLRLAMQRLMVEEEAFLLNHAMRMSIASPIVRLAHFLLELHFRLRRIGLASPTEMPFPLDRNPVACALGLSPRDVRRAAHALQGRRIVRFGRNRAVILKEHKLRSIANFTPPEFSTAPRSRRLINDISPAEMIIRPQEWVPISSMPPQTFETHHRPAWSS